MAIDRTKPSLSPACFCSWLAAMLFLWSSAAQGAVLDLPAAFDEANKLYEQGRFGAAADAYEQLRSAGQNTPAVLFNLGNARFRAGEIGRAVIAYLQAQRLAPREADIRQNLEMVRRSLHGGEEGAVPAWRRWLSRLSANEWTCLAGLFLALVFLLLALREWRPSMKQRLSPALQFALIGLVLAGAGWGIAVAAESQTIAVVVVKESAVRFTPLDESPVSFNAQDGNELLVLEGKPGAGGASQWFRVTDALQRVGWIKRDQIAFVRES